MIVANAARGVTRGCLRMCARSVLSANKNTGKRRSPVSETFDVPRLVVVRTRPAEWLRQKQTRHISPAHRALRQGPRYMLRFCRTNKSIAKTPALPKRQIFCVATKVRNPLSCPAWGVSNIMIVRAEMALRAVFATHHGICRKTVAKPAFGKKLPVCRD